MTTSKDTPTGTRGSRKKQGMMGALETRWRLWWQVRQERIVLQQASDATLKDIGLTRQQVRRETSRPFWQTNTCR
ncbi:DUF1127 domain-containing protein [Halomonas sp. HMF6819]|uniref:DUF1127 domain-containing protein n=1 Tax=Halomonas sp. HMF6819 TaxID=3373085 RepID=UPI00378D052E